MAVKLSESAAARVKTYLARRGDSVGLRLGVKSTGCSGLAYTVDYADGIGEQDTVFESRGVKVIVSAANLAYVDGTEIDFREENMFSAFHFTNPNATGECGCGESFTVS